MIWYRIIYSFRYF